MVKFITLQKEKIQKVPKTAGVYALKFGKTILYIGKASNLKERIKNHFQKSSYRDNLYIDQVSHIGYIETESDIDALLLESELIKKQQPKYNVMWRDDKKYFYIAIDLKGCVVGKEKFTRVFITHQPRKLSKVTYIGPFVNGKAVKHVLRLLRRAFPYYTAKKHGSLRCSWCHIDRCPGPDPNLEQYKKNIQNLKEIFRGKKTSVLRRLKKDMGSAAKKEDFEAAGSLRDQVFAFERVLSHASVLSVEGRPIHQAAQIELKKILNIRKSIKRIEAYDISNIQGKQATGSMVVFLDGKPTNSEYRKFKIHIAGKPDDFAMMQELITRRLNHPEWKYPQLMIIDGGKGQLSSALKALKKSKANIAVAAIAKRNNELFLPGKLHPLLLKNLPQNVSNLILHIRDEAHRFAISYHRLLRKKNIRR
ncbi:GIY-YIG nuclease family protein [Patescibacteria group bacterium]|nr:GIY-YIG nuclease family protein [Patescibacteria group bacterium]